MKKNPFLKAEQAVIKKVYSNSAVLKFNVKTKLYITATGAFVESVFTCPRNIFIKNPHEIADAIVDGKNYIKGDLSTEIAYQELVNAVKPLSDDPIMPNNKDITDYRRANTRNGGIEDGDTLEFDGTEYRIVKITPKNFYAGVPSRLKLQMRSL